MYAILLNKVYIVTILGSKTKASILTTTLFIFTIYINNTIYVFSQRPNQRVFDDSYIIVVFGVPEQFSISRTFYCWMTLFDNDRSKRQDLFLVESLDQASPCRRRTSRIYSRKFVISTFISITYSHTFRQKYTIFVIK